MSVIAEKGKVGFMQERPLGTNLGPRFAEDQLTNVEGPRIYKPLLFPHFANLLHIRDPQPKMRASYSWMTVGCAGGYFLFFGLLFFLARMKLCTLESTWTLCAESALFGSDVDLVDYLTRGRPTGFVGRDCGRSRGLIHVLKANLTQLEGPRV